MLPPWRVMPVRGNDEQGSSRGFSKGSGPDVVKHTEAKPEIWTKWSELKLK